MRRAMGGMALALVGATALFALGGCLLPGREGWKCKKNSDCTSGLACRSYYGDKGGNFCAKSNKVRMSSDETYNWFHVIAGWAVIIGLPGGSAAAILVSRRRQRRAGGGGAPPAATGPGPG